MGDDREWIERRFRVRGPRAPKVASLRDAVASHVRAGDAVHLGLTHARGSAGFWELLRQHHGADPGFTLLAVQMTTPLAPLVHAGLARKIVTSWSGNSYWSPGPNRVYQRAWDAGIAFEHWSILTYAQRLQAAARGVAWTTTRSLAGSSMAEENDVRVLDDGTVLIPALLPDVSILHAPAADAEGNVLFAPPLMENVWGALAARRGCIVTVDRIVEPDVIRANAHMTRLPSSAVLAVVEVPYGAHPGGLQPAGIAGATAYGEDWEFWVDLRDVSRDPGAMDAWIAEWLLEPDTHDAYLAKLGPDRIASLRRRSDPDGWREQLDAATVDLDLDETPNALETAIVAGARALAERIEANGYTTMLAGAGMANLAAWLAAYDLADRGAIIDLVAEMGLVGYWPRPGEPILFNQRNFPTCTMLADIEQTVGVLIGGGRARSIGALGAAQVDRRGNINSTLIPGEQLLMGSGGANDVITCASESVIVVSQERDRFCEQVPYVTGPGERVQMLVSTLGVYRREDDELILTGVYGDDAESSVRECRARCGWDLRVARTVERVAPPTREELRTLRLMDPQGWFRT
ncbi:MAG TPA: CoA-transferase [Actinomycetota bacterium]